jgi:hypothetical protein
MKKDAIIYDTRKLTETEFKDLCLQYPEQDFRRGLYVTIEKNLKYIEKMYVKKYDEEV